MATSDDAHILQGSLYVNVAFDWGDEIDLVRAATLAPSHEQELARRPRTPASLGYRPAPLRFPLEPLTIDVPGMGQRKARLEASAFDFAGVNVRMEIELAQSFDGIGRIAGDQTWLQSMLRTIRTAAEPLRERLLPAIQAPACSELAEEYLVFRFEPSSVPDVDRLLSERSAWLAGVLRLESQPLSAEQIADAISRRISYTPGDLVAVDWAAAVIVDRDCEETLQTLEFANLQLLEFRLIDRRLDDSLAHAYKAIHSLADNRRLFYWRSQDRPLRVLGDIKIETEALFDRAGNTLKLVGDQYLSKVYRVTADRLHLNEWSKSIHNSLEVVEGVYRILADQASAGRIEAMELIVIVLIAIEILLSIFAH